ncbi:phage head-tail connector protein [Alkalihalophilus marmarensis]|uniref:phage head-tail connector protein n=1 Tax=Alkalihalophilus marmarensis TaxID=521377 RepID=UPI0020409444|nr:phage head-tail connector protein [Alkalihalophilus marmarensis]MCM3488784.1 phage head-tail connector protein [Alkalihalophilus marmarensis]
MDLEELKVRLGVKNDLQDAKLQLDLEDAIDYAKVYCKRNFLNNAGELELPSGVKKGIVKLVQVSNQASNVTSKSVGGELSVSYGSADHTETANAYFKPYRMVRFG